MAARPERKRILLVLPPFWPPQIPPVGIVALKSHLEPLGHQVQVADANVEDQFRDIYTRYFEVIKGFVSLERQGNLYGVGTDVLKNHFMAHVNQDDPAAYSELVRIILARTYYTEPGSREVEALVALAAEYFRRWDAYVLDLLEQTRPDVFGVSVFSGTAPSAIRAFRLARQHHPRMLNVMGGGIFADHLAAGSPNLEYFLERTQGVIDKLIIGEGEILFARLLAGELDPNQRVYDASDIQGELLDLSRAALLDFSEVDLTHYPYSSGYTSRSCPFQCAFCSETVLWGRYRRKPPAQAAAEFQRLHQRDGTQLFSFSDSLMNPIVDDLSREFIAAPKAVYWDACLRADKEAADPDKALLWRQGGFYKAWLGLESGSQRVLDLMNKRINPQQIQAVLANLAGVGIKTATLWLIGHPGETEADFQATLDLIELCRDDIYDAEGTPFWYFPKGQSKSGQWGQGRERLLYPEWASEMLLLRTWVLDGEPSREVTYERLNRFMAHLRHLGIPNPYNLLQMHQADERWRRLHLNAVPALVDFDPSAYLDECRGARALATIAVETEAGDFGF
jgi:radical SAM superfamily enzyme YgiQ (UPF0313 family)